MDQASLLTPSSSSAFVAALHWLVDAALGSIATAVAVLAVAGIGFLLLTGRIDLRRSASVILGCFLLFGARTISASLLDLAHADGSTPAFQAPPAAAPRAFTPPPAQSSRPSTYDPYAGAAVPPQP